MGQCSSHNHPWTCTQFLDFFAGAVKWPLWPNCFLFVHAVNDDCQYVRPRLPRTMPEIPIDLAVQILLLQVDPPCICQLQFLLRTRVLCIQICLQVKASLALCVVWLGTGSQNVMPSLVRTPKGWPGCWSRSTKNRRPRTKNLRTQDLWTQDLSWVAVCNACLMPCQVLPIQVCGCTMWQVPPQCIHLPPAILDDEFHRGWWLAPIHEFLGCICLFIQASAVFRYYLLVFATDGNESKNQGKKISVAKLKSSKAKKHKLNHCCCENQ